MHARAPEAEGETSPTLRPGTKPALKPPRRHPIEASVALRMLLPAPGLHSEPPLGLRMPLRRARTPQKRPQGLSGWIPSGGQGLPPPSRRPRRTPAARLAVPCLARGSCTAPLSPARPRHAHACSRTWSSAALLRSAFARRSCCDGFLAPQRDRWMPGQSGSAEEGGRPHESAYRQELLVRKKSWEENRTLPSNYRAIDSK